MSITREKLLDLFEYKDGLLILKKVRHHGTKVGEPIGTLQKTGYLAINYAAKLLHGKFANTGEIL